MLKSRSCGFDRRSAHTIPGRTRGSNVPPATISPDEELMALDACTSADPIGAEDRKLDPSREFCVGPAPAPSAPAHNSMAPLHVAPPRIENRGVLAAATTLWLTGKTPREVAGVAGTRGLAD